MVQSPGEAARQVDVLASMRALKKVMDLSGSDATFDIFELIREGEDEEHRLRARSVEFGDDLMILKFPEFFLDESQVDSVIGKAKKHKALVIDLRQIPAVASTL